MKKLLLRASALTCLMLLPGCAKEPAVIATSKPFCQAVQPVCISRDDSLTDKTARRLLANEYGREAVCGKPPRCPKEAKPTS